MPRKADKSIVGNQYAMLTVLELTNERNSYGRLLYRCECSCGRQRLATRENLLRGEVKHCGCVSHRPRVDAIGKKYGMLTVIAIAEKTAQVKSRCKYYRCACDCGEETVVSINDLTSGKTRSCGCLVGKKAKDLYVDGTAPCKLDGSKIRKTNTSGVTGVWYDASRQLWVAEITFKGKKHSLGRFSKKEDAAIERKNAEQRIFKHFLDNLKNTTKD